jgi:hypothetical protein
LQGRGRRRATNWAVAVLSTCRGTVMGGGDYGRLAPIPLKGRRRRNRRSSGAWRRGPGRCGTARASGCHGDQLGRAWGKGRGGREHAREREERIRESKGAAGLIPSSTWASRRWRPATSLALPRSSSTKKTNRTFAKAPLDFGKN